jgi:hypothetical protein
VLCDRAWFVFHEFGVGIIASTGKDLSSGLDKAVMNDGAWDLILLEISDC